IVGTTARVPGGLRYALGRALLEVEAPPFDTLEEFSEALARFETGERHTQISRLHVRAMSLIGTGPLEDGTAAQFDRRRNHPSHAELRRQLREADLRLYEARQSSGGPDDGDRKRMTKGPIAACMVAGLALVAAGEFAHSSRQADMPLPTL